MTETSPHDRTPAAPDGAPAPDRTRLSREVGDFLVELSIGAHRYAMYPPDHPSLGPVADDVLHRLEGVFADGRTSLSIGVAGPRLVIGSVVTEASNPVLGDLARRLREHQIAALVFERGVRVDELQELLAALAGDTSREASPVGALPPECAPAGAHVRIVPVGYEGLAIREGEPEGGADPSETLWLELARSALATEAPGEEEATDVAGLARSIREGGRQKGYDEVVVGYLRRLARELRRRSSGEATAVRRRLADLIEALDDDTLAHLVRTGVAREGRGAFLLDVTHGVAVDAVMKILRAAATSEGQSISTSLTRMLGKLAAHAGGDGPRARRADAALRDTVDGLLGDWLLDDPNPHAYTVLLDGLAGASPLFSQGDDPEAQLPGPERVVQMALEVDAWGGTVGEAVDDMLERGAGGALLQLVAVADDESTVADRIRARLGDPAPLLRLLSDPEVVGDALGELIDRLGPAAIDPLLEVLAESDSRSVRRRVFDALGRLGPEVAGRAAARLDDPRWFVVRNMLALLARLDTVPADVDIAGFTRHPDERVRREAFALAMRPGSLRSRTLARALGEEDERLVRMALLELRDGVPEALVPTMVTRVLRQGRRPEIRALAVRALEGTGSGLVRDALLDIVSAGRTLLRGVRLAEGAPDVLAALSSLAGEWSDDPRVEGVLSAARRSKHPPVRQAVGEGP